VGVDDDELAEEELLDAPPTPAPAATDGTDGTAGTAGGEEEIDPVVAARSRRRRLVGAVVVLVAAVAALGLLFPGRQVPPGAADYQPGTADEIEAALPVLRSFVERTRGLRYAAPVSVTVLGDAQYRAAAAQRLPGGPAVDRAATARALGLGSALDGAPGGTNTDGGAFYSYAEHRLVLRDGRFDAYARAVLVHALTHALDDQRFDLLRLVRDAAKDADRGRALGALIEGDAARVAAEYTATLPAAEQRDVRSRLQRAPAAGYLANEVAFPAAFGASFVTQLVTSGGSASVDAAFGTPPISTAQIVEPRLYVQGVTPVGVRAPQAGGTVVDAGTLGRFGLAMLITRGGRVLDAGASGSWQGDAYVTYRSGGGYCTRLSVVLGEAGAQQQLRTDLAGAPGLRTLTLFGTDTVRMEFCTA
jgi:hypothetical protein